jgi:hypothetical protein
MVLLFNTYITDASSTGGVWKVLGISLDRGHLSNYNKIDILKYCLASLAVAYPWKRAIINIELDTPYNTKENSKELEKFVKNEFKNIDLIFSFKRNLHQEDWISTYGLINSDVIAFICNHDHIFLDNSTKYLEELVQLKDQYKNLYIALSHYPEFIRMAKCGYIDLLKGETTPSSFWETSEVKENHVHTVREIFDSIAIISKSLYENWFLEGTWDLIEPSPGIFKTNKIELGRTEGAGVIGLGEIKRLLKLPITEVDQVIPYREMFRHFDGYWHQQISNNHCPSLDIPPGFFENDIKIRYGYDDYKEGWVNINPKNPNYQAYSKSGTDYKFTLQDLPRVWKGRISVIDSNPSIDEEEMISYRLKAILEIIYNNPYYDPYIDEELKNKILEYYLQLYPQYKLE